MDKFQPGTVCYHKATKHRCVVLSIAGEIVKVRDEKNQQQDYYPQELETEEEINTRNDAIAAEMNRRSRNNWD